MFFLYFAYIFSASSKHIFRNYFPFHVYVPYVYICFFFFFFMELKYLYICSTYSFNIFDTVFFISTFFITTIILAITFFGVSEFHCLHSSYNSWFAVVRFILSSQCFLDSCNVQMNIQWIFLISFVNNDLLYKIFI